jgi:hypothetical protein
VSRVTDLSSLGAWSRTSSLGRSFAVSRGAAANNDGLLIVSLRVTLPGD